MRPGQQIHFFGEPEMSQHESFAVVVQMGEGGSIAAVWKHDDKYDAKEAAQERAAETAGALFVVMEVVTAYMAKPVVNTVYLPYPTRSATPAATPVLPEAIDI